MGFRFRKSFRLGLGVRLNVSKRGAGVSLGGKGFTHSIGPSGRRTTISAPGTGVSYSVDHKRSQGSSEIANAIIGVIILLGFLAFVVIGVGALFR
jgi:hypothetical protein